MEYSDSRGQTGNFNSHAHVERDLSLFLRLLGDSISTHTLTWSVTLDHMEELADILSISTHTLTWSVTVILNIVVV